MRSNIQVLTFVGNKTAGTTDGSGTNAHFGQISGIALNAAETILYVTDYSAKNIRTITIATKVTSTLPISTGPSAFQLSGPSGIVLDSIGNLYFCDGNRIGALLTSNFTIITLIAGRKLLLY